MKNLLLATIAIIALGASGHARAGTVSVVEAISGSAGAWTLDFTVTNTYPTANYILQFAVATSVPDVIGSPANFTGFNGGWVGYNNIWNSSRLAGGTSLSGFEVYSTEINAPTLLGWGAYIYDSTGLFVKSGTTTTGTITISDPTAVPEPASMALLGAGIFGLGMIRRRKAA